MGMGCAEEKTKMVLYRLVLGVELWSGWMGILNTSLEQKTTKSNNIISTLSEFCVFKALRASNAR